MGSFFTAGKNGYYWKMLSYLQDPNVYDTDKRVVPYTPNILQTYIDFYPQFSTGTVLMVFINGNQAGKGTIINANGCFSARISPPQGDFTLEVRDTANKLLKRELFTGKIYAMFLEVAAQSYEERLVAIEQVKQDVDFATIRSERIYPVVGVHFAFPPPPGWTPDMYRSAVLGDNNGCPGFINSFFYGGTLRGVVDTIKSITCGDVTVKPAQDGERWVVFDRDHARDPLDPTDPDSWFVADADTIPLPNHRIFVMDPDYVRSVARLEISNAERSVVEESVLKVTDSFIESPQAEAYVLSGKTLSFSIETVGDPESKTNYFTVFGLLSTTAAQAAADILTQNPLLSSAVYAENGKLRIGVLPEAGVVRRITVLAGTALSQFGFAPGDSVDVAVDILANPYRTGLVTLTFGGVTYIEGSEFTIDETTGEIIWVPSTALVTDIPPKSSILLATYNYLMKREIFKMVNLVKNSIIEFEYVFI